MNNETEDRDLQRLFRQLRRSEANQSPPFARVCPASTAREGTPLAALWRFALGTALAAAALLVSLAVAFRGPAPAPSQRARQPDAAALAVAALRTVSEWSGESPSLARWVSPTAFLLSPLGAGSTPATSERN